MIPKYTLDHWDYEDHDTHFSFFDEQPADDYDFRVEFGDHISEERAQASIALIAAAPVLVEALLAALPYVEDVIDNPEQLRCFKAGVVQRDVKKIRDALAKAGVA